MSEGIDVSFYDRAYFDEGCRSGKSNYINYYWERIGGEVEKTARHIINRFDPEKSLDVGCAKGFLVKALCARGVDAYGIDASAYAVANAPEEVRHRVQLGLAHNLPHADGAFDFVTIFDVLEHIPEALANRTCAELLRVSSRWVLAYVVTRHEPDDIDPSHITIKPKAWWETLFRNLGGTICPIDAIYDPAVWWFNLPDRLLLIKK
ncbi:MAG: class I SAM-dependent methyltransferase [Solirubrobacterales bacterium]